MSLHALEELAQITADWLWEIDANGRITHLSDEGERYFGCPASELLGSTRDDISFDALVGSTPAYREAIAARAPFRGLIYAYRHPDGAPRWFEISGRPLWSPDGMFLGYRGVGSDVSDEYRTRNALVEAHTKLRDANNQLTEQNRRFNAALENMTQGLCMFDAEGRLLVWNKRYLDIFGLSDDSLNVGMSQRTIIEKLVGLDRYRTDATVDSISEGTRTSLTSELARPVLRELADGRVIAALHRPMEGGGWVATFEDVTERRRNEARINHMARHDALTDLPNRTALREIGNERIGLVAVSPDRPRHLAVLCLDLDRFKPVNDSFGHAVGDLLLRAVAERLRNLLPREDLVARFGGDEFAVLHGVESTADATAFAQRLIASVSAPYEIDEYVIEIGISVGIALAETGLGDIDRFLKNADMALYEAKAAGRGTYCLFKAQMDETARERTTLERQLREALVDGGFVLHYQPLIDITGASALGRIKGLEALVRWRHSERGLISPDIFIPLAEETGLIVPLGAWVLNQACRDAAAWPETVSVAVNVSALQLRHRGFAQTVMLALSASGLDASRLELEITESVLLDDTEANLETLHTLRQLGIRISMDDFGTGYSSISYLRRFPFDKIKIDRSFVRDAGTNADAAAIIRAIVRLGASLGITTLVEGIETETQLAAIRAEGAQEMQGFLFSPPRPSEDVTRMLKENRALEHRTSTAA